MFSGAQVSLYPTSGSSACIIIATVMAIALKRVRPRIETDAVDKLPRTARRKPEIERR